MMDWIAFKVARGANDRATRANLKSTWGKLPPVLDFLVFPIEANVPVFSLSYRRALKLQDIQVAPNVFALRFE